MTTEIKQGGSAREHLQERISAINSGFDSSDLIVNVIRSEIKISDMLDRLPEDVQVVGYGHNNIAFLINDENEVKYIHKISADPKQISNEVLGSRIGEKKGLPVPLPFYAIFLLRFYQRTYQIW